MQRLSSVSAWAGGTAGGVLVSTREPVLAVVVTALVVSGLALLAAVAVLSKRKSRRDSAYAVLRLLVSRDGPPGDG
ncbi:hypothetical protein KRMM14A1259_71790 [Krasilnikovia sp. MM14-A1259]